MWVGFSWPVGWRRRHPGFAAQPDRKSVDGRAILAIFSFDNGANSGVSVVICSGRGLFDVVNFPLPRRDIGRDGVLSTRDVGCGVVTPSDGCPELPLVLLHGFGGAVDRSTSCFRGIARPDMRPVED
jgi:hypothetical protein